MNATEKMTAIATIDRVSHLPGLGEVDNCQFAGYVGIEEEKGEGSHENIFYWFVGTKNYAQCPTIIWTNGGPGSSSFWGFFLENGPYKIDAEGKTLSKRAEAWNDYANYMIFEHPLSVTLSFVKDSKNVPSSVEEGIDQLYTALLNFMDLHPEIAENPIILAGESYAGTYLPLFADAIFKGNHSGKRKLKLQSMSLIDAWVDPMVQMATGTTYAFNHGLISREQKRMLDERYQCDDLAKINDAIQTISGCYMADIANAGDPSFDPIFLYLNQPEVRQALHITQQTPLTENWSSLVGKNYTPNVNASYAWLIKQLLEENSDFKIQIISGLNDAKDCNFLGTEAWLHLLQGNAAEIFKKSQPSQWKSPEGRVLGFSQGDGSLNWLKVLNAGHMAPMNQPKLIKYILEGISTSVEDT